MSVYEILGFAASVLIGVSLGLIGGGGSILTVPVLVYLLGVDPVLSTALSLFVVGTTSLVGSVRYMQQKLVDYRTAIIFAIPSFIAVYATRKFIVPNIPDPVFTLNGLVLTKAAAIMIFFAVIMLLASYSMIRKKRNAKQSAAPEDELPEYNIPLIAVEGVVVGVLTGMVGAGGGFLIIPALVLLAKLPMKKAVGTSLLIISAKSLIGFLGDVTEQSIDWPFLLIFTSLSVLGIFLGTWLSRFIHAEHLKRAFGWFVLVMAIYILAKELWFNS